MILAFILGSLLATPTAAFKQESAPEIWINADKGPDTGELLRAAALGPGNEHWLTAADYPRQARRERRTATIQIDLSIAADDRLTECKVIKEDKQPGIASAVCPLIAERGKFRHALALDGSPVPAKLRVYVGFHFRDPEPLATHPVLYVQAPSTAAAKLLDPRAPVVSLSLTEQFQTINPSTFVKISAEGELTKCNIVTTTGSDVGDLALCRRAMLLRFSPALDAAGRPERSAATLAWIADR